MVSPTAATATNYKRTKERARAHAAGESFSGRNIGPIPPIENPARRIAAMASLAVFCKTYQGETFYLPWSDDHLKVIAKMERAVILGELFAIAMPRGTGKTSLCEAAALWAILTGRRCFVALIGSDDESARDMLESIKTELETNDLLAADFPEVCYPIRALDGINNRAAGQLYKGRRTRIKWSADRVVFPTIPGSAASGAIIRVAGITGNIRGMKFKRRDGSTARPDFVDIDDPQTDESARSEKQCIDRRKIINGAILKLSGPGKKIAGVMPCTVVRKGDLADVVLDREQSPQWQGERMKLIYDFPDESKPNEKRKRRPYWDEYADILVADLKTESGRARGNAYYQKHRAKMDAGARVAWEARHDEDELSAIQHAMNQRILDPATFWAELQNEPQDETEDDDLLTAAQIISKLNNYKRRLVPSDATRLTAFVDVQKKALYYLVAAWAPGFTGYVIDWGTWPDQRRRNFLLRDIQRTLMRAAPRAGLEGALYKGLDGLAAQLLGTEWTRDDGATARIDKCFIDANWAPSTETVYTFCRQSTHAANLTPSHGIGVTASNVPLSQRKAKRGDLVGPEWRIPVATGRKVRHIIYDANHWKTFVHARLAVAIGDKGALSLWGDTPGTHQMIANHLTAEYRTQTEGRGRTVWEWKLPPNKPDNHLLDCLAGAAVAASTEGIALPGMDRPTSGRRRRVSFREQQQRKRAERARG